MRATLDLLLPTHIPDVEFIDWALEHAGVSPFAASDAVKEKSASLDWSLFETQMMSDGG